MARMFVIPASDQPVAVILRRGPSAWYHVILWDTQNDVFTRGAWIKGRIYEQKCDLSPDGTLFVCFVHQGSRVRTEFTDAWTAVSRPPWLHALIAWPQGTTYGGGGRFINNRHLALRGVGHSPIQSLTVEGREKNIGRIQIVQDDAPLRQSDEIITGADWSGYDQRGRVIFTIGGGIYSRTDDHDIELADFTNLKPDAQPPPEWATRPL